MPAMHATYRDDEGFAREMDLADPLRGCREQFHLPTIGSLARAFPELAGHPAAGEACVYLTGNSLGLQPRGVRGALETELRDWAELGVEGHVHGKHPWLPYHRELREMAARLVGGLPHEVVVMNSLTVNLHLLMVSFYRPTAQRYKIVIEDAAFPSDSYAVGSQADLHGFVPSEAVVRLRPRAGERTLRTEDVVETIRREGSKVALVMLGAVNYSTGQFMDMPTITKAAHEVGAIAGWDLAHAAGNVVLKLHEWNADFACWCSYKYLNSGPGAIAGAYVHERHARDSKLKQFAGWWGNDEATRFKMGPDFSPVPTADRWQISNPPIFSLTPVRVSLEIYDKVGMAALREKSLKLTGYLEWLIDRVNERKPGAITVATPRDEGQRGCQLSLVVSREAKSFHAALQREGVITDFREPDVVRAAPVPLYNSFHDVWRFGQILKKQLA
ncbi:MAG: kynureninase [Phycisphaerales bacterium]